MSDVAVVILTASPDAAEPPGAMAKVDGRESVLRCMELFTNREGVVQTMVVIDKAQAEEVKRKIGSHLMFMGIKLVSGGSTWADQLADAQAAIKPEAKHVLVHDGARPAISYVDLDALFAMAGKHPAVALASLVKGPVAQAGVVPGVGKPSSDKVAKLLTPMLFTRAGYDLVVKDQKLPGTLQLIEGSPLNLRCGTYDAGVIKAMINLLPKPKMKAPSSPFEEAQW
jgi:hypothetical protein